MNNDMNDKPIPEQDEKTGRFVTGNIGGGRQKGSRNKLGEDFIAALHADFQEYGMAAIQTVRAEKPDAYIKVIASILPKELKITNESDLTDDELIKRIRQLDDIIRPFLGSEGAGGVGVGDQPAPVTH